MIVVATTERNGHPIPWYLESCGAALPVTLVPVHYEALLDEPDPVDATYCFADLELLDADELERAAKVREELVARGCRVLNDPERTLTRFDLLRGLHDAGINDFTAHRERAPRDSCRYPVFLHGERDHDGRRSPLLASDTEVDDTIRALRTADPALDDLLIVEFCHTADDRGIYRKYSAFVLGDAIHARHLLFSRDWHVKDPDLADDSLLAEELAYVDTNPHAELLRPVFDLARVEYGRIDYSLHEGQLRVWEINTNPTIVIPTRVHHPPRPSRGRVHEAAHAAARKAVLPVVYRTRRGRAARSRAIEERARAQPRAAVKQVFTDRFATAWSAIDAPER